MRFAQAITRRACASFVCALSMSTVNANELATPVEVPASHKIDNVLTRWMEPNYPSKALQSGIQGDVTVEFDISKSGHPVNPVFVESTSPGTFDGAVLDTLNRWTVVPFRSSSCFKDFPRTRITVSFRIEDGKPKVTASRPTPLSDPASKKAVSVTLASDDMARPPVEKRRVRWIHNPPPYYPKRVGGREAIYGNVVAVVTVEPGGNVGNVEILFSAPYPDFGESAAAAIRNWKAESVTGESPDANTKLCQPLSFRPEGSKQ